MIKKACHSCPARTILCYYSARSRHVELLIVVRPSEDLFYLSTFTISCRTPWRRARTQILPSKERKSDRTTILCWKMSHLNLCNCKDDEYGGHVRVAGMFIQSFDLCASQQDMLTILVPLSSGIGARRSSATDVNQRALNAVCPGPNAPGFKRKIVRP